MDSLKSQKTQAVPANLDQNQWPEKTETPLQAKGEASVLPSDIQRLAQDLVKANGEKFTHLFGAHLFGLKKAKEIELKKEKVEKQSQKVIERVRVSNHDEMRAFVAECLDPVFQKDQIIDALTEYLCRHYEILKGVSLNRYS